MASRTATSSSSTDRPDPAPDRPNSAAGPTNHSIAAEFALVVVALAGFYLWQRVVSTAPSPTFDALPFSGSLLVDGLARSGLMLAGLCLLAGAHVTARDIEVGAVTPDGDHLPLAGLAFALPAALVGLTKAVGDLTGVPFDSLTFTTIPANAPVEPLMVVTGLGILAGVPSYLLTCQIVLQGSFRNVVDGDLAVALTTVVAWFLLTGGPGGLSPFPELGKLVGAVLLVLAVGVALYVPERTGRRWLRSLAYLPAALLVALVVLSGVAAVESVAGGLFALTQVAVLGLAAYAYERTETLVVPALAYLSLSLTSSAVVFVFEAGMQSW